MTTTTITAPAALAEEPHPHKLRNGLFALSVAVLLVLSFAIGRWTSSAASASDPAVTATTQPVQLAPVQPTPNVPCNAGRPC